MKFRLLRKESTALREEHARLRNRLERVIAIKGVGSLPPPLPEGKVSISGSTRSSTTPSPAEPMPTSSSAPAVSAQAVSPPSTNDLANAAIPPTSQASVRRRGARRLSKRSRTPAYTHPLNPDAAIYFEVIPRTIHRWKDEGHLKSGARRGSITIESIRRWENEAITQAPLPVRINRFSAFPNLFVTFADIRCHSSSCRMPSQLLPKYGETLCRRSIRWRQQARSAHSKPERSRVGLIESAAADFEQC